VAQDFFRVAGASSRDRLDDPDRTRRGHGESLVDDPQFWITRPYEWKKLLTAKALSFVAFVNLPLLIGSGGLVVEGGLCTNRA
jgi:hypothetical protein